jgi:hypothetical protein
MACGFANMQQTVASYSVLHMQPVALRRGRTVPAHRVCCAAEQNRATDGASQPRPQQQEQLRRSVVRLLAPAAAAAVVMLHPLAMHAAELDAGSAAAGAAAAASQFEPRLNPGLLAVALIAAAPPIIFWGRIFISAQRRDRQIKEEKEAQETRQRERDELARKLWGEK